MYRILLISLLVNLCVLSTYCQTVNADSLTIHSPRLRLSEKKTELYGGYALNRGEENKPTNHILDIGISRTLYNGGVELSGYSYYISNGFVMNKKGMSIMPKIGGNVCVFLLCIGSNIGYYTDFKRSAVFVEPYFGLGLGPAKLYLSFNIPITEKKNENINIPSIGLSLPLYKIR